ncbi:hypothetical protein LTR62_006079 [Meristemomyces frigidus]|uniref:Uncharacterized protein n=1 Tax=Meristemomyces frigidus TaxID=1508187 RepID=A0AAN7TDI3_9PEZI|nr:hypothetical protein LTR62_006079 [Meristemomyces frigidus]
MALAFDNSRKADNDSLSPTADQDTQFGKEGYYDGYSNNAPGDAEKGGYAGTNKNGRKMSRIDRPVTKSIAGQLAGNELTDDDATDPSISVGKQMELEAGNTIKYRTCSWYKV